MLSFNSKAQHIISVEKAMDYRDTGLLVNHNYVHVKDVNDKLPKFIGIWKGTNNNQNFEFSIVQITTDDGELKEDKLLMRFKIIDSNGKVIEDITTLSNNNYYVLKGAYLAKTGSYVFDYWGRKGACGQNGEVFVSVYGSNNTKMQLFLAVDGEIYPECKTGRVAQILPTDWIYLTKQ